MGGQPDRLTVVIATMVAAVILVGATLSVNAPAVAAKKSKGLVACPAKVGPYKLDEVTVQGNTGQICDYHHSKRPGWAFLMVIWHADEPRERSRCSTRAPRFTIDDDGLGAKFDSASRKVDGLVSISDQSKMPIADAEEPLRQLVAATEALAHTCVPEAPAGSADGPSCPLLLPHDLVRTDWYVSEAQVVEVLGDGSDNRYGLTCTYMPAYTEDGDAVYVKLEWREGDPGRSSLCNMRVKEFVHSTKHQLGYHPVSVDISNEFAERWDGQSLADALVAAAAARTSRCPDAPEGPAPYENDVAPDDPGPAGATGSPDAGVTTIVLSGGPADEPPAIGATIELPEDDQHQLVVGGPDGEVIREEFLGDQATISGYGPIVTDAEGNWSVLVDVDVSTAAAPTPQATTAPTAEPTVEPTPVPVTPAPTDEPTPAPTVEPTTAPTVEPTAAPSTAPGPTASPTAVPPPVLVGVPDSVAALVADLPPEAAGAVRNLTDQVFLLGEDLAKDGAGEVTIRASDIASLRALAPDLVTEVWLKKDAIVISTNSRVIGSILVKPVIGQDGLIEVKLNRFKMAESHHLVRTLVAALNGYVDGQGGRFSKVSVTPDGLEVIAERK